MFDRPRLARGFFYCDAPTACLRLFVHIYATRFARNFAVGIRLAAFDLVVVRRRSLPCLLQLCLV